MIIGIDRNEVVEYVSVMDMDKENPTKFLLGVISGRDRTILAVKFEEKEDPSVFYDVVKKGLKGIKGLKDKKGVVSDFDVISDEIMDFLPIGLVKELFFKLVNINFLSEQEAKN